MRATQPFFDLGQLLGRAVELHRAGNLTAAQALYAPALHHDTCSACCAINKTATTRRFF
jgi:hypothetical protein